MNTHKTDGTDGTEDRQDIEAEGYIENEDIENTYIQEEDIELTQKQHIKNLLWKYEGVITK